jgi:MoaA/NifB/PqqE/SkfB family radical SAM enzyme
MECAHRRGVRLTADNGANFNRCEEAVLEGLVKYRFASLRVALDGASAETYGRYRLGGRFESVVGNVWRLNEYKAAYGSELPKLTWQFVVFGHNEHELPAARAMARELGMEFEARLSWDGGWSPVKDPEFVRGELGLDATSREEYRARFEEGYMRPCHDLWRQPTINWDGRLLGCCVNFSFGDFGNVFSSGLGELMEGEGYRYAQGMVTGEEPERGDIPCARCHIYREMKADGRWVKRPPPEGTPDPQGGE